MNRREFLKLSALTLAAASLDSCASFTSRYSKPDRLVAKNEKLLLKNARIIDVKSGRLMGEKNILIRNGIINKLLYDGEQGSVTPTRTVDLKGAYVIPGLINAHCHLTGPSGYGTSLPFLTSMHRQAERNAEECIKHGVTTIRDLGAPLKWMDSILKKSSNGTIVSPRIIYGCGLQVNRGYLKEFDIFNSHKYWNDANNPKEGRDGVKKAVDGGAHCIKLFQQKKNLVLPGNRLPVMDLPTMRAVTEEANKQNRPVAVHHVDYEGFINSIEAGAHTLEHMVVDKIFSDEDIRKIKDSNVAFIPTSSVGFALSFQMKGDPNWGMGKIPYIVEMRKRIMPGMLKEFLEPDVYAASVKAYREYNNPKSFERRHVFPWLEPTTFTSAVVNGTVNIMKLYRAGVMFGCGNDGGAPFIFPGAIPLELCLLEDLGVRPRDALRMATINNAKILRMEDKLGSIDEGKFADLVVYRKNPLHTMRNTEKPLMVFKDGELVFQVA